MSTENISLRTDPEKVQRLDAIAKAMDRSRNYVMGQALDQYLAEYAALAAAVQEGHDDVAAGRVKPHDEVMADARAALARHGARADA